MSSGSTLLITFDGLRRDRATHELMPNLAKFMEEGSNFINSRSIFPSETRVAVTSTMTGCPPSDHGVVANQFIHPIQPDGLFNTASWDDLETAARAGVLVDRETLGQRMSRAGRVMAVLSTATPGASRMMNSSVHDLGQPVFSMHGTPVSSDDLHNEVIATLGAIPSGGTPNSQRMRYATDALMRVIYPRHAPDMCVFWMNDPDLTSHAFGITAAETEAAQQACDENFGRILAWWKSGNGPENIIVMSDHGQITGAAQLSGLDIVPAAFGRSVIGSFSDIYLHDRSQESKAQVVSWLAEQDFCGPIFASDANGEPIAGALQ